MVNMSGPSLGSGIDLEMFGGTSDDQYIWFLDTQGRSGGFFTAACIPGSRFGVGYGTKGNGRVE
jgi:hypothetical protein